jgi:CheY-like chemotaxis protein/two-component sensor histidine kinase
MMYSPQQNASSRRPLRSLSLPAEQVIDQLKRTNGHQSEFLTRLSHELRNPLAPMHHALQLLRMQGNTPGIDRTCAMMQRQLSYLVKLIDELLDIERINQGKLSLSRQSVVLQELLQGALEIGAAAVRDRGHHLKIDLPQAPIYVKVDPVRMTQVVANLLINAAKYTPPSGSIELRAQKQDDVVLIDVKDNGIGLNSDDLTRVFDLYAQVASNRRMAEGGLGVGLALAQKVIQLHGGQITASSAGPGQGSTFSIRLPLVHASAEGNGGTSGSQPQQPAGRTPVGRILIVDDNVDGADTLTSALQCLGHEACACYDGQQALERARHLRPQAALLDLSMPGMDGFELARQLRCEHPHIRLAAMTGWGASGDRERCLSNGFQAHIVKPASIEEIESVLTLLLEGSASQPLAASSLC